MNFAATLTSILVGGVVFLGAVVALARAIFRQASSTEANAKALNGLAETITQLQGAIDRLDRRVDDHEVRLAVLDDRRMRGPGRGEFGGGRG